MVDRMDVGHHRPGRLPPKKLTPQAEKRLGIVSLVLIAVGLIRVIRLLATGKRPAGGAADVSSPIGADTGSDDVAARAGPVPLSP